MKLKRQDSKAAENVIERYKKGQKQQRRSSFTSCIDEVPNKTGVYIFCDKKVFTSEFQMQPPLMIAHPPSLDRISQLLGGSICINMSDSVLHQNQCKCAFCSSKYLVSIMDSFLKTTPCQKCRQMMLQLNSYRKDRNKNNEKTDHILLPLFTSYN